VSEVLRKKWNQLLTPVRLMPSPEGQWSAEYLRQLPKEDSNCGRSQFQRDYDRLIFSPAFRRLARKTQVHPLADNDHIHTRLIHSLEVACVGRSLGAMAGERLRQRGLLPTEILPEDVGVIVQSACLAHDIGNPPFGHTGEDAIRDWFSHPDNWTYLDPLNCTTQVKDLQKFEGNAQGFRLVARLEKHANHGGLRLTLPTLGAMLKYPWYSDQMAGREKFGCYASERQLLEVVAEALGLEPSQAGGFRRHPLVYLVEAADDICYRVLDLEDAVELNMLPYNRYAQMVAPLVGGERLREVESVRSVKDKLALIRGPLFDRLVNYGGDLFSRHLDALTLEDEHPPLPILCPDSPESTFLSSAKIVAETEIFNNRLKNEIEVGVYATLAVLLNVFMSAAYEWHAVPADQLSRRSASINELMGSFRLNRGEALYDSYRKVIDFLSGMTDFHASRLARTLGGVLQ